MKWMKAWFWSSVKPSENWAQTLVRVFGNLFRIGVTLIAVVLVASIAVAGYFQLNRPQTSSQVYSHPRADEEELVRVMAIHSDSPSRSGEASQPCSKDKPLMVVVENKSSKAVYSMTVQLSGRVRGTSSNVLDEADRRLRWDHIVPPQHFLLLCYALTTKGAESLVFSARPDVLFNLVEPQPWMLRETVARPLTP